MASEVITPTTFFIGLDMPGCEVHSCASGTAAVLTSRCPGKESGNEDAAALLSVNGHRGLLAVADGLGGQPAGEQASSVALHALSESVAGVERDDLDLREAILDGFEHANQAVAALGVGAGTTLVVAEINGPLVRPYHVGDSMILVVGQRGKLKHQTISHSPIGYGLEAGLIEEAEAIDHVDRHLVSNIIGSAEMRIDVGPVLELRPRDTLLLASDGLFDNLYTAEIVQTIRKGKLEQVAERLTATCHERMHAVNADRPSKPDDLTFITFRLEA